MVLRKTTGAPPRRLLKEEREIRPDGGVDQHGLVKILVSTGAALEGGDGSHRALLEHPKGVALSYELVYVTSAEGPLEEEHDVFDHVLIGDEVKKGGERLNGLRAKVLEFDYQLKGTIETGIQ